MSDPLTMRIKCVRCATDFPATVPQAERINAGTFSAFVWAHPLLKKCPNCGQTYQFIVQGMKDVQAGYVPVDAPEEKKLVVPATVIPS